jgi:hypothetical protein
MVKRWKFAQANGFSFSSNTTPEEVIQINVFPFISIENKKKFKKLHISFSEFQKNEDLVKFSSNDVNYFSFRLLTIKEQLNLAS